MRWGGLGSFAWVSAGMCALSACGGPNAASLLAKPPELPTDTQAKCRVAKSASEPLVIEWPSEARGKLESLRKRGLVAIRYDGCEVEVLSACTVKGPANAESASKSALPYRYSPITRKQSHLAIKNEDELYASLPIGAVGLEGKLKSAGQLDVDMTLVGRFEAERAEVRRDELEGRCDGVTHLVAAFTVGAFTFSAGAKASVNGKAGVANLGGGVGSEAAREMLSRDGDAEACARATGDDTRPPDQCGALIRIEVVPVSARAVVVAKVEPRPIAPPPVEPSAHEEEPSPATKPIARPAREPAREPALARPYTPPSLTPATKPTAENPLLPLDVTAAVAATVGLNVGWISGLVALSAASAAKKDCVDAFQYCNPQFASDASKARAVGMVSNVAFITGGVGVMWFILRPSRKEPKTTVSVTPQGAVVRGTF